MEVVEVEQPQRREEHQHYIDPGLGKGRKTEEELADDLIDDENDLPVRRFPGRNCVGSHPGLEQRHCHHRRYEHEYRCEEEGYTGVDEVLALEADHGGEEGHHLNRWVVVRRPAADHAQQKLGHRDEEQGDKEGYDVRQQHEGKGEPEFLAVEGVADVDDVEDDQNDHEDDEVEHGQEGVVVDAGEEVVHGYDVGGEVEDVVEGGAAVPDHEDGGVEGELYHLQVVHPRLVQQVYYCYVLVLGRCFVHDHEQHIENRVFEVGPQLPEGAFAFGYELVGPCLVALHSF